MIPCIHPRCYTETGLELGIFKRSKIMNSYKYLDVLIVNVCRIIYNINNFPSHSDYIIRQERKDNLINLVKQACLYILYAFAFGMSLFSAYILLMLGCVLNDSCYYYYGGV